MGISSASPEYMGASRVFYGLSDMEEHVTDTELAAARDAALYELLALVDAIRDGRGTLGLVMNRPGSVALPDAPDDRYRISGGGPVAPDQVVVLGRGDPPEGHDGRRHAHGPTRGPQGRA